MIRSILFSITNIAILTVLGALLSISNLHNSNIIEIIIMSGLLGFIGSIFSLLMSKSNALNSVKGKLIIQANNETEKWLLNTVHQQALKVNINNPDVAIYPSYTINAFATGFSRNNSLIAVSSGLLKNMNKQEAEAVIAHEMSHIINGDMVTMTLMQGVINTFIIFVSRLFSNKIFKLFFSKNNNKINDINHYNIYSFISTSLEFTLGIFANIIVLWFSRHREFYADAGAAKLVGCEKMIAALQCIKNSNELPKEDKSIIAFCINGGYKRKFSKLFSSHPSIEKRIEALKYKYYL